MTSDPAPYFFSGAGDVSSIPASIEVVFVATQDKWGATYQYGLRGAGS